MSKFQPHNFRYRKPDGSIVPSVTTITGEETGWSKRALNIWNNNMGLKGIDTKEYVKEMALIGRLAHLMVTNWLIGEKTDIGDFSQNQISIAENSALSFFEWAKGKQIEPIWIEKPLVSKAHDFGGTADIYALVDSAIELIDLKTSTGVYADMKLQVSAYRFLLIEHGKKVERVRIINIPRAEDEGFKEELVSDKDLKILWEIFLNCLKNYQLRKRLNEK